MRLLLLLIICCAFPQNTIHAATFCVTNSSEFSQALLTAQGNAQDDDIRLSEGVFAAPSGGFGFEAAPGEDFDLEISGGWTEFFGNDCGQRLDGPPVTTINGLFLERGLEVFLASSGVLRISGIAFINGRASLLDPGGGLWIRATGGFSGRVLIERNLFFNNEAVNSGALQVVIDGGETVQLHVVNNLIRLNRAQAYGAGSLTLSGGTDGPMGARLTVVNNTVVNNIIDVPTRGAVGGLDIRGSVPAKFINNNNFWGNDGIDLTVAASPTFAFFHNNVEQHSFDAPPSAEANNLSTEPRYEPCQGFLCFTGIPVPASALHDAGLEPTVLSPWSIGSEDYRGFARSHEGRVDIGAFESHARVFKDRFEVE